MKILAFDTSSNYVSVALSEDNYVLHQIEDLTPSKQAERLVPIIEEILSKNNISYEDIDYLAVTNGPGSFTGIRIALACAKAMLLESNMQASAVNNFEVYKYNAIRQIADWDKIIVLINAYRGQLYVKIFDKQEEAENSSEPLMLDYKDALSIIAELSNNATGKIYCVGNGLPLIYDQLNEINNLNILPRFARVRAMHICRLIAESYKVRRSLLMEPLYIRPPDAKIKL